MASLPKTQKAVAVVAKRAPLGVVEAPVHPPSEGEVVVRVEWTASTPLDLHRADGGLLVSSFPSLAGGGGAAGEVVAVGAAGDLKGVGVGDKVMSFAWRGDKEANHQQYITIPAYLASKLPAGLSLKAACTIPVNLVTVFHACTTDLHLELPWPIPSGWSPEAAEQPILIWGASSSVGLYALQVLRHWGYKQLLAVSSGKHHMHLKLIGASACFDYRKPAVAEAILAHVRDRKEPQVPFILDCIGSLHGTLDHLSRIAQRGSRVAVMLPVIVKDATAKEEPEYAMDVEECLRGKWADGVVLKGTRTHFYLQNDFFKEKLQPEIVPALVANKVVEPNRQRVVEGATMLERAQKAIDLLRAKDVSGERLVWQID